MNLIHFDPDDKTYRIVYPRESDIYVFVLSFF